MQINFGGGCNLGFNKEMGKYIVPSNGIKLFLAQLKCPFVIVNN